MVFKRLFGRKIKWKKILLHAAIFLILGGIFVFSLNAFVAKKSKPYIFSEIKNVPECYTAIVLGALVSKSGYPSDFLQDRLDVAIELYQTGKVKRFLLSGDHGHPNYDEVNNMKQYLLDKGVKTEDVFLDHAGFDTYNTMVRAKKLFLVDKAIVVSQQFHLPRAIYIARSKGIDAYGIIADRRVYFFIGRLKVRELLANVKAFLAVITNKSPHFLGTLIPITGDSRLSYD